MVRRESAAEANQLAAAIALSQQECGLMPQQHPQRPKRERRRATGLTNQTQSAKTEMALFEAVRSERYFERMQQKQQKLARVDGPAEVEVELEMEMEINMKMEM